MEILLETLLETPLETPKITYYPFIQARFGSSPGSLGETPLETPTGSVGDFNAVD